MSAPHTRHDGPLLIGCGIVAIIGSIALLLGNIIGSIVVPDHDWMADTVSDLAAGKYEIIQDVTLYFFAVALAACALGASHIHLDRGRWNFGVAALSLLAITVAVIGARNEYGDNDNEGVVIHIYLVYALGVLFTVLLLSMGRGMGRIARRFGIICYVCAALWIIGAPIFFVLPTTIDGAYERGLGIITLFWTVTFG